MPDRPLCHNQSILKISWKSTFYSYVANRHAVAHRWETVEPSRQVWNSLNSYFLGCPWHFIKISWTYVHPFLHNIINKHGSREHKHRPWIQGINRNFPKMLQVMSCLIHVWPLLKISWKSVHLFSRDVANRHGFPWKHRKRNPVLKVLNVTLPQFSRVFLLSCPIYREHFMKVRSRVFP